MNKEQILEQILELVLPKCDICKDFATSKTPDFENIFGEHRRCDNCRADSEYVIAYDGYIAINNTLNILKENEHRGREDYNFADLLRQYLELKN